MNNCVKNIPYEHDFVLVCYSHSSYCNILNIQCDYLKNIQNVYKVLIIDKIVPRHYDMTQTFDKIIFYDENINYTKRVYKALTEIKNDETITNKKHILFTHDNDILVKMENETIKKIMNTMDNENIHRTGLNIWSCHANWRGHNITNRPVIKEDLDLEYNYNPGLYFTVNPGIWNLDEFIKFNEIFNFSYSTVENFYTMSYCNQQNNVNYLHSNNKIRTTRDYVCSTVYIFIKITDEGKIMKRPNHSNITKEEEKYLNEYDNIISIYSLKPGYVVE